MTVMVVLVAVVVVLASYRITRFVTTDTLLDGWRDGLESWAANGGPVHDKVAMLFLCPYCIGFWISVACYVSTVVVMGWWQDLPLLVHGLSAWAVAGAQSLLVGWDQR